jgi:hypothetical protein
MPNTETLPPRIDGFSGEYQSFPGRDWFTTDTLIFGVGFAIVGIVGVVGGIAIALLRLTDNPPLVSSLVTGGGVLALLIGGTYLVITYLASQRITWLFREGFIRKDVFKTDAIRWAEIAHVIDNPRFGGMRLELTDGRRILFAYDEISRQLYAALRDAVCDTLVPLITEKLRSGATVDSGPIAADRRSLKFQATDGSRHDVSWDKVVEWTIGDDGLAYVITVDGGYCIGVQSVGVPDLTVIIMAGKSL